VPSLEGFGVEAGNISAYEILTVDADKKEARDQEVDRGEQGSDKKI
jgi:hypothetical protein